MISSLNHVVGKISISKIKVKKIVLENFGKEKTNGYFLKSFLWAFNELKEQTVSVKIIKNKCTS
jgi:hypothetical protein